MYQIKGRTTTMIDGELVTRTYYASTRQDKSDSAQTTARMIETARAERKARGRTERQEEI